MKCKVEKTKNANEVKIELTVEEIKRICVALDCFGDKRAEIQGDAYGIQYWRIRDKLKKYIEVKK